MGSEGQIRRAEVRPPRLSRESRPSETLHERARGHHHPQFDKAETGGNATQYLRRGLAECRKGGQGHGAVTLGETGAVGAEHQRHVGKRGYWEPQQLGETDLARGAGREVVPAYDLGDSLDSVVHHHGEVLRGDPVVAAEHHIVDSAGHLAE